MTNEADTLSVSVDVPQGINIRRFEPGRLLQVQLSISPIEKIYFLAFSAMIFLFIGRGVSYVLQDFLGAPAASSLIVTTLAIAGCIAVNIRGARLTILIPEKKYYLVSPLSWARVSGLPVVQLQTIQNGVDWRCDLAIAGHFVGSCNSNLSGIEAERPLKNFFRAFPQLPLQEAGKDISARQSSEREADALLDGVPRVSEASEISAIPPAACPLIILVHGTWGTYSEWTFPDKSLLVQALQRRLEKNIEFRRFAWSGHNRSSARAKAAEDLANEIHSSLQSNDRLIYVLAHSHGGNIAVRAFNALSPNEKGKVRNVLMATPFLYNSRRFDVLSIYNALPSTIRKYLEGICMFGFWFGLILLMTIMQSLFVDKAYQINPFGGSGVNGWQVLVVPIMFFFPFFLFWFLSNKAKKFWAALNDDDVNLKRDRPSHHQSRFLNIAYAADEAFQALSIVINLLSLVHQAAFILVLLIARTSGRFKIIDVLFALPWLLLYVLWGVIAISATAYFVMDAIASVLPTLHPIIDNLSDRFWGLASAYVQPAFNTVWQYFFISVIVIGMIIMLVIFSALVMALLRFALFSIIGVIDQAHTRSEWLNALLGTVSIATVPEGTSESYLLSGGALFNHVKIYDDERTIEEIVKFVRQSGSVRAS